MKRFAMLGAGGFVAPRHMQAIYDTDNALVAACDPYDSVGILDRWFPDARFFTEVERFDRHLEKIRRRGEGVDYISVCTPNYLHDAHCRLALRVGADAICEKPLVISPWNLDQLGQIEEETGHRIHTVLQLRLHPALRALKDQLDADQNRRQADIELTYITRRGAWYQTSWKGSAEKSGTLAMNIGIHFFDLLAWLFGPAVGSRVHLRTDERLSGVLELAWARVRWFLSVDGADLPAGYLDSGKAALRTLTIDGAAVDFSEGFTGLHTRVYEDVLAGGGFGLDAARPSIEMVHHIRTVDVTSPGEFAHPLLK